MGLTGAEAGRSGPDAQARPASRGRAAKPHAFREGEGTMARQLAYVPSPSLDQGQSVEESAHPCPSV